MSRVGPPSSYIQAFMIPINNKTRSYIVYSSSYSGWYCADVRVFELDMIAFSRNSFYEATVLCLF